MIVYVLFISIIFIIQIFDKMLTSTNKQYYNGLNDKILKHTDIYKFMDNKKQKKSFTHLTLLAIIIIYLFSALRFDVGWDYYHYYRTIEYDALTNIVSLGENGTIFLINLAKATGMTSLYFTLNSFICIYCIMVTIKNYSKDHWVSILFFVCFPLFFLNSFSVIRLFSALALTFYGFKYIERKEFKKYLLIVIIAGMLHKSAFAAIILYFVAHYIELKNSKLVAIYLALPIFSNLFEKFILNYFPRYSIYFRETSLQEGTKAIYVFIVIAIVAILFRKKIIEDDITASLYYNIFFAGLAIYLAFIKQGTLGHRFSLYGTIYSILLVPKIISIFRNNWDRILIKFIIYFLCIIMFLFTVYVGADTYIPYQTIFGIK
ncbi:MAG: EpsG family protein [Tissierellaceae bacterium]|jgi:hypothetical protein